STMVSIRSWFSVRSVFRRAVPFSEEMKAETVSIEPFISFAISCIGVPATYIKTAMRCHGFVGVSSQVSITFNGLMVDWFIGAQAEDWWKRAGYGLACAQYSVGREKVNL